jgi:hypothetical protein
MPTRTFEDFIEKTVPDDSDVFPFKPIGERAAKITWYELKSAISSSIETGGDVLSVSLNDSGNIGNGFCNLKSIYTAPNILESNGYGLEIEAWGKFGANNNGKVLILTWLSEIFNSGNLTYDGLDWQLKTKVFRENPLLIKYITKFYVDGQPNKISSSSANISMSSGGNLVLLADGLLDDDIVCHGFTVKVIKYIESNIISAPIMDSFTNPIKDSSDLFI